MKRVVILESQEDYWEACYVDGVCVGQAHHLGEGSGKIEFLKPILSANALTLDDVIEVGAEMIDDDLAMQTGQFPDNLSKLQGDYNFD
jgi:hypothetical protein